MPTFSRYRYRGWYVSNTSVSFQGELVQKAQPNCSLPMVAASIGNSKNSASIIGRGNRHVGVGFGINKRIMSFAVEMDVKPRDRIIQLVPMTVNARAPNILSVRSDVFILTLE